MSAQSPSGTGRAAEVVMYSKTTCPYCHRAERVLRQHGVSDLSVIQIDREPTQSVVGLESQVRCLTPLPGARPTVN